MMRILRGILFALVLLLAGYTALEAQCYGNPQAEANVCAYTPLSLSPFSTCGNCTYAWGGTPASGQGTQTATYVENIDGIGHAYRYYSVTVTNPNVPCTTWDMYQTTVGLRPNLAIPSLINGPWNGDTAKVWLYARTWNQYPNGTLPWSYPYFGYFPNWIVNGGTIVRNVSVPFITYGHNDTLGIKWNGSGPMSITEGRTSQHAGQYGLGIICNWAPQSATNPWPALQIFHPTMCVGGAANVYTFPFPGSTYTWSVSNGTVVSGQGTNSIMLSLNGASTVSVLRDSSGFQTNYSTTITPVIPNPNLGPDRNLCQGSSTTLTVASGFISYAWSTGATTQSINVTQAGQYRVTATMAGGCTAADTINITVLPTNPPNLGPDLHPCTFPVTLDAGPGYTSYAWSNGATTQTVNVTGPTAMRVTVTEANGCATSDTIAVFGGTPNVNLGNNRGFCLPGSLNLSSGASNYTSLLWSTGATTYSIPVSSAGPVTYWCRATSAYGCQATDTVVVTGNAPPTPNAGPNVSICPGSSITLNAGPGYASYWWGPSPFTYQQTRIVSTPGNYVVTVTDNNGCQGMDTVTVSMYPFTLLNLGPDINVCQPNATLNAGAGYSSYLWSNGATTQSTVVSSSGAYSVTVTGAGGCTDADTINVTFNNFSFSLGPNQTVCEPATVFLDPQLVGNFTYLWGNGSNSPTQTLTAPGTYLMTLAASNGFGCANNDTVVVTIMPTLPSQLGADTIICADTTITLDMGPGFVNYQWNNSANTQSIVIAAGGHYEVTATSPNGCVRMDTVNVAQLIDCVFPGDVDYDGVANSYDAVALGLGMGLGGPTRANASLQWYGQKANSWGGSIWTGADFKQGDTDGDGSITLDDTLAIQLNYGNNHARIGSVTSSDAKVTIVPVNGTVAAGDTAYFYVYLTNDQGSALDSVFGIAMHLDWSNAALLGNGLVGFNMTPWFAPNPNARVTLTHLGTGSAEFAISRFGNVDTTGQGYLGLLAFATDPTIPSGQSFTFAPTVGWATVLSSELVPMGATAQSTPSTVVGVTGFKPGVVAHVSIWPVPATDALHVMIEAARPMEIRLVNALGQVVRLQRATNAGEYVLGVGDLPAGTYSVQVLHEEGLITKQITVAH